MLEFTKNGFNYLLLAAGLIALLAAVVPVVMAKRYTTPPIIYIIIGIAAYFAFSQAEIEPLRHIDAIKHLTEFVVIVSLTNAGLKIKKAFTWQTWRHAARLLAIAMPITIVAAAYLGWWVLGFAPATAMLFGALIAPTDPVLAAELQTSQPSEEDTSTIKLGLTAEAGLNDGLAFPFTYFAIMAANKGTDFTTWIGEWVLYEVLIKISVGVGVGVLSGWLLHKAIFKITPKGMLGKISRGILSLSLTLLPYAISELAYGYGFIAVFVAACVFSRFEKHDEHMDNLHDFNEELEGLFVALLFIATGVFIASHYNIFFDVQIMIVALIMVFVVRPAAGWVSLAKTGLSRFQRFVLSFYGIRGIGSIFYLMYALSEAEFGNAERLLNVTMVIIFLSVLVHGLSARTIQKKIKQYDTTPENEKQ